MIPATVELTQGHSIGIPGYYLRIKESDILQDYEKVIDRVTINENHQLKKRVGQLETEKDQQIVRLQAQIEKIRQSSSEVLQLKAQFDEMKKKMDQIDLVDLQHFPEDYTIHNLLADYGIEEYNNKQQPVVQDKVNPKRQRN